MSQVLALAGYREVSLLPATAITDAVTALTTTPVAGLIGMQVVTVQAVMAGGASGTSITAYVQTTVDGGSTWIDIICVQFANTAGRKVNSVRTATAVAANYTPADGSLTANTIKDGLLGSQLRLKYTSVGTYDAGTTLTVSAVIKGMGV